MRQYEVVIHHKWGDDGWYAVILENGKLKVTPLMADKQQLIAWLTIRQSENP